MSKFTNLVKSGIDYMIKADPRSIQAKGILPGSFFDHLDRWDNNSDLGAYTCLLMYKDTQPFFSAVDMRAKNFAAIPIKLWDKSKEEFVKEHPVLDLLEQPNGDTTGREFKYAVASFLDITGNSYLHAGGRIEKPPLELAVIAPQNVVFPSAGNRFRMLNIPDTIQTSSATGEMTTYHSEEDRNTGLIRYLGDEPKDKELWHIRDFNPLRSDNRFTGMSKCQPLFLEIQQYLSGNKTNWSILKRGTRISMAWVNNRGQELTETQWQRMQTEADKYAGDSNSGGTPILDGMDVKAIQSTFRDMQFQELQQTMVERISNVYGIPLPLVLSTAMTLDNLTTAKYQLFDGSIFPLADYILGEFDRFLLPRYEDTENLNFAYTEKDIPTLEGRVVDMAKKRSEIRVNTVNELRSELGNKPAEGDGGDIIFRESGEVPIGSSASMDDLNDDGL